MHQVSTKWRKPKKRLTQAQKGAKQTRAINQKKNKTSPNVSNQNQLPILPTSADSSISATTRKFSLFEACGVGANCENQINSQDSESKSFSENGEFLFVHSSALKDLIQKISSCECGYDEKDFKIGEKFGHAANLKVECKNCGNVLSQTMSSPRYNQGNKKIYSINEKLILAFLRIGGGYSALQQTSASLDMSTMSIRTYYSHLSETVSKITAMKTEILSRSRQVVRDTYERIYNYKNESVVDIFSSFDGSWQKKGFTSLYSIGCVIDVITGLVIDYEILSKYCHACVCAANDLGSDSPEFDVWFQGHRKECNKNYDGSSVSMEVKIADILWRRSISQAKFRYTSILSDGDAKVFKHLTDSQIYDTPIEKQDCINHVKKRMGTALRNEVQTSKKRGITLGGRSRGALTDKVITALTNYYGATIKRHGSNTEAMRNDILATLSHCSSTDDDYDHTSCPRGIKSWCFFQKAIAKHEDPPSHETMPIFINATVVSHIRPVYERLSTLELLSRCSKGLTQNANEALHAVLWRKCPKITFVSKSKIELSAIHAISEFNMGVLKTYKTLMVLNNEYLSANARKIYQSRDAKRKRMSDYKNDPEQKRKRIDKKYNKKKSESETVRLEGSTYGAGCFGE